MNISVAKESAMDAHKIESHLLGPGGLLHIPPNVGHWGEVVGGEPVLNLDIFTPLEEAYAPGPKKGELGPSTPSRASIAR